MADTTGGTESTSRVADVLLLFVEGPSTLGVSRIARDLGLSKAVVHRILQSLAARDMVALDPASREYRLGGAAAALGARALRDSDLRSAALPLLRGLRDETRETATLSTPVPHGRVYLDQVVGLHEIKMTVELGRRFPLHAGSSGKCMLAHLDPEQREEALGEPLEALTPHTPVDAVALRGELDEIVERGWAVSAGERQADAGSVAAPVFGVSGDVLGAISVCGPRYRMTDELVAGLGPRVAAVAAQISRRLGGDPDRAAATAVAAGRSASR
ncbi:IclR family transcriptional regulator [Actinomycetospora lutea]|uniref:IclR family transcriptional regulator n=1 Tax=Actinomycetospora lutea TaxID=663604 RepID=UPI002365C207|nr:IclR family transcriptional regulator [Actinomycetospora lutea]MDD7942060.1 IclR family transcriptional regulator [Actinomycetospora lutea]